MIDMRTEIDLNFLHFLEPDFGGDGKAKKIKKRMWAVCVEAVLEYSRVLFDLFPEQETVCSAS